MLLPLLAMHPEGEDRDGCGRLQIKFFTAVFIANSTNEPNN